MKYGMEGYGLYWYCLELIARNIDHRHLTFELEEDAELIASDTGIHSERVEEMMTYMVQLRLFECTNSIITCLRLATRVDEFTSKHPYIKDIQKKLRITSGQTPDNIGTNSGHNRDFVQPDKMRLDKIKYNYVGGQSPPEHTNSVSKKRKAEREQAKEILNFLNEKTGRNYRHVESNLKLIMARLRDGATPGECRQVIAKKTREWKSDETLEQYLRPATLFNATKFAQYQGELIVREEDDE